tara:strand:+ start:316 stop:576 length:261 start_codon:yes stop_codon:yes gene_type:complete
MIAYTINGLNINIYYIIMEKKKLTLSFIFAILFIAIGTFVYTTNSLEARGGEGRWCTDRSAQNMECGGAPVNCYCMDPIIITPDSN